MAADERWYFTKEEINNSPSRKCGIDTEKELSCRQQGAKLIQDMGQRLHVTQLVINTAIVYMHRFYMFHSFAKFHRNSIAPAALFLAAKVEEQPRKLEHVIKVAHYILFHHEHTNLDTQSEGYLEKAQELVMNENILLQTLGFDVAIDHPHTYVVKCFQMVRTTTELAQTSYFMATNSLHMTTMCLQYRPAVVACVCIYIVCKWSNYEIQRFTEGKDWFCLVDPTVTVELLEQLTSEFLAVLDKYPSRLKKLMNSGGGSNSSGAIVDERGNSSSTRHSSALSMGMRSAGYLMNTGVPGQRLHDLKSGSVKSSQPPATKTVLSHKEYSEKREKERKEREKMEQKERFAAPFTLSIPSSSSNSTSNSATTLSHSSSNVPHSRTLPPPDMNSRKPVPDASRHLSAVHGVPSSTRHFVPTKDVSRKELPPFLRSGDTKFEKQDRISDNSVKVSSDKLFSSSADHKHSSDWYHAPRSRDKKLEIKDVKLEPKLLPKDTRGLDSRELKSDPNSGNGVANSLLSDHKVFPKSETSTKIEFQPDVKPHGVPLEDIKPTTNSFIFNNDDFSLRDFLNPSAMPPEDIFDTESTDFVDFKDETGISKADMLSLETTHTKLLSPPSYNSTISTSFTVKDGRSPAVPSKSSNHLQIPTSKTLDSHPTSTSDAKHALKQHVSPSLLHNSSKLQAAGNFSKQPVSTGSSIIQGTGNSSQPQISSNRKREKKSPGLSLPSHSLPSSSSSTVSVNATTGTASMTTTKLPKATLPNSDSTVWLSSLAKSNDQSKLLLSSKASNASSQQILVSKEDNMAPPHSSSLTPFASSNVSQKRSHSNHPSTKLSAGVDSTTLNERLISQPENVDASANKLSSFQIPVMINSGSTIQTSVRRHKHEHGHHKHKKKKKHKHKESSKHRDKEKKAKKHKKHKDKDKEKCSSKTDPGSSLPLKITLRTKGVHPQHESSSPAVPTLSSPHSITHTHSSSKEHHNVGRMNSTGLKLTIPKSRLQVSTPTPDQLMANHEAGHQKMKLKLPKDDKDASRKRARDDHSMIVEGFHPSKMARSSTGSSSSYSAQVSSQQNWTSQRH